MSAFQIGVECTSKVSSWSFRPARTARRPNDSSPVSTGRLNKKSASFFSASLLLSSILSLYLLLFSLSFILSFKEETVAPEIGQQGREVETE